jgi:hypothetical protein
VSWATGARAHLFIPRHPTTGVPHAKTTRVGTLKRYSKALEYEYRVKTAALVTLKRYSIISLTLYLE